MGEYTKALMKTERCRAKSCCYNDPGYDDNCSKGIVTITCEIRRKLSRKGWEREQALASLKERERIETLRAVQEQQDGIDAYLGINNPDQ